MKRCLHSRSEWSNFFGQIIREIDGAPQLSVYPMCQCLLLFYGTSSGCPFLPAQGQRASGPAFGRDGERDRALSAGFLVVAAVVNLCALVNGGVASLFWVRVLDALFCFVVVYRVFYCKHRFRKDSRFFGAVKIS